MMRFVPAVIILVATAVAGCSSKGQVREPTPLTSIDAPAVAPSLAWSRHVWLGDLFSRLQVVAEADALFVTDRHGHVQALSPQSGEPVWEQSLDVRASAGPGVAGDLVLVGTLDAEVIALSRADGSVRWRSPVSSEVMAVPVGAGDIVVARTVDGRIYGLDAATGEARWQFDRTVPSLTLRGLSKPALLAGRVFAGLDNGRMVGLEGLSGEVAWEQLILAPSGRTELERIADIDAAVAHAGGDLFVASAGGEVAAVDGDTGQVLWRRAVRTTQNMAVVNNTLIVSDRDGVVWALDARTGSAEWKQEALQYRGTTAPAEVAGYIVVGDDQGYLHWLQPETGALVGRHRFGRDGFQGQPMNLDGQLVVQRSDGRVGLLALE
jgi:outer membrane protein assembly factor BamB